MHRLIAILLIPFFVVGNSLAHSMGLLRINRQARGEPISTSEVLHSTVMSHESHGHSHHDHGHSHGQDHAT